MSEPLNWWTDGHMALEDAKGLARAGELAARALEEEGDRDAFSAQFRALDEKLNLLQECIEAAGKELKALRHKEVSNV